MTFYRAFHGRSYGALSIGASKAVQRKRFGPLLPGVLYAHYPYFYRDVFNSPTEEACVQNCLNYIEEHLFKMIVPADELAAIVVEPIQGEGGYVPAPASFLLGLQAMARQHGILVIADEVQSGMGRTGHMWASQHTPGFEPDIICAAKGIASGLAAGRRHCQG
jgi:4-aminobutyrate aminotransferase